MPSRPAFPPEWVRLYENEQVPASVLVGLLKAYPDLLEASHADALLTAWLSRWKVPNIKKLERGAKVGQTPESHLALQLWQSSSKRAEVGERLRRVALSQHWESVTGFLRESGWPWSGESGQKIQVPTYGSGYQPATWLQALVVADRIEDLRDYLTHHPEALQEHDSAGRTALFLAVSPQAVQVLLEAGMDPTVPSDEGLPAAALWQAYEALQIKGGVWPALLEQLGAQAPHALDAPTVSWKTWAQSGPEAGALAVPAGTTVTMTDAGVARSYGLLAYLARESNDTWSRTASTRWANFLEQVSDDHLRHESIPGVPDGWVAATAFGVHSDQPLNHAVERRLDALWPNTRCADRAFAVLRQTSHPLQMYGTTPRELPFPLNRVSGHVLRAMSEQAFAADWLEALWNSNANLMLWADAGLFRQARKEWQHRDPVNPNQAWEQMLTRFPPPVSGTSSEEQDLKKSGSVQARECLREWVERGVIPTELSAEAAQAFGAMRSRFSAAFCAPVDAAIRAGEIARTMAQKPALPRRRM